MAQLDRVRDALHQQPFRAFELRLVDGRSYIVKHPDFVALPPGDRKRDIVYYDDAGVHLIDLALILEIIMAGDAESVRSATADNGE
jgi:hypothetical protein